jgi:hypothetical protein
MAFEAVQSLFLSRAGDFATAFETMVFAQAGVLHAGRFLRQ